MRQALPDLPISELISPYTDKVANLFTRVTKAYSVISLYNPMKGNVPRFIPMAELWAEAKAKTRKTKPQDFILTNDEMDPDMEQQGDKLEETDKTA